MCWVLDQPMEDAGAIGAMVIEQLAVVNNRVPDDPMFSWDGQRNFISDHEERFAECEGFLGMVDHCVHDLQIANQVLDYKNQNLWGLVDKLLVQVTVLEGQRDSPIELLDSPVPIPIPPLASQQLTPIDEEVVLDSGDERVIAIAEDQTQ